jgi:hypothetical protein
MDIDHVMLTNPIKFLEILPDYAVLELVAFLEKNGKLEGVDKTIIAKTIENYESSINKIMEAPVNAKRMAVGAGLYAVGYGVVRHIKHKGGIANV